MSEREPLAPGRITSTKPDDSERDYRDCVDRMDEAEPRLRQSEGGRLFLETCRADRAMTERAERVGRYVVRVEDETGGVTVYGPFNSADRARHVFKALSGLVDSEARVSLEELLPWPGIVRASEAWQ